MNYSTRVKEALVILTKIRDNEVSVSMSGIEWYDDCIDEAKAIMEQGEAR